MRVLPHLAIIMDLGNLFSGKKEKEKVDDPVPDDPSPPPPAVPKAGADRRELTRRELTPDDRVQALLQDISGKAPPQLAEYIKKATPFLIPIINYSITFINLVGPLYLKAGLMLYNFLDSLPIELYKACLGLGLCFFGGSYCASIAAAEAFYATGWPTTKRHLKEVYQSAMQIYQITTTELQKQPKYRFVMT